MNTNVIKKNIKIMCAAKQNELGLLRFITAGSVDDGKSTLIGRLLFDSKGIFADQLNAISHTKYKRTKENIIDLSLLTDGLEAEREQGITIDVAYRYFATPKRKFIIADTPGHEEYTRNMITGASTADAQVILIDASKIKFKDNNVRLLTQTKRHSVIANLLQVQHIIIAVNKMDLVNYSQTIYNQIIDAYLHFAIKIGLKNIYTIPLSALIGDNVVNTSKKLFWYKGPTLIKLLESLPLYNNNSREPFRFPIQLVTCYHDKHNVNNFRGYMGRIEAGKIKPGEKLLVLPNTKFATVKNILTLEKQLQSASTGQSVTILLEEHLDISRGDMLVSITNTPTLLKTINANLFWLSENKFDPRCKYWLKHSTKQITARITKIHKLFDINTQQYYFANTLKLNDIAQVSITAQQVIVADAYNKIRATGAFILIDEITHQTVAAGIISYTNI